jgi:sugar phosphate isomerase/epimerase
METASDREIYFSFFMFTADLQPDNSSYTEVLIRHLQALASLGYDGFDLHIAPPRRASVDPQRNDELFQEEIKSYSRLKEAFDNAGLKKLKFATNVGTTQFFDPTSPDKDQGARALEYLKSRVRITSVLGGESSESIMSGPFIYPYGAFPLSDLGDPIWSDDLLDWMKPRYRMARPIIEGLAEYALENGVKLAIEPVKSWETPPPNMVSEVLDFLDEIQNPCEPPCGITIDTAQVLMESRGPTKFRENVVRAFNENPLKDRLLYVHISAPDRGAVHDSWIPWDTMLDAIEPVYRGPYLIEVFNAIPPFDSSMRMMRRRFWRPGEDKQGQESLSAYYIADAALKEVRHQIRESSHRRQVAGSACGAEKRT